MSVKSMLIEEDVKPLSDAISSDENSVYDVNECIKFMNGTYADKYLIAGVVSRYDTGTATVTGISEGTVSVTFRSSSTSGVVAVYTINVIAAEV